MSSDYSQGCRTSAAAKGKRDDISPAAGAVDSLYQRVDVNNDNEITLAEYIGWVTRTQGQDVASNVTLLTLWIEKFEAYVFHCRWFLLRLQEREILDS